MAEKHRTRALRIVAALAASLTAANPVGATPQSEEPVDRSMLTQELGVAAEPIRIEELRQANFGSGFTWTAISAADFEPLNHATPYAFNLNMALGQLDSSQPAEFAAPLLLPNGAIVDAICLLSRDNDTMGQNFLSLRVVEFDSAPAIVFNPTVETGQSETPGWIGLCANFLDIPYRSFADLDDNGTPGDVMYSLIALMSEGSVLKHIAGAVVVWHRTMSPPPATPTFSDVPTTHLFFRQIEALAASEVTGGCGGNKFCPNAPLTRGQMAAFLAKALGLHWFQ